MAETGTRTWTPIPVRPVKRKPAGPPAAVPMLPLSELDFAGCEAFPLTRGGYRRYEGRLEVWDAETETAWRVRSTTAAHESPAEGLVGLVERIAAVRGSPIRCYGSTDLLVRDAEGEPRRVMQADQVVYLYPSRVDLLGSPALVVGEHPFPDVVLEVDHTTDVRRGKLRLYESWGFPELWVEVPERRPRSRPRRRRAGLTIHLLEGGAYRESPVSRAFPGWRAKAIHTAMNEAEPSGWTHAMLEHLGRTLGERDGTGPDDDPLLYSLRDQSRTEGRAEGEAKGRAEGLAEGEAKGRAEGLAEGEAKGRAEGLAEGEAKGRAEGLAKMAREVLRARGVPCSEDLSAGIPGGVPDRVVAATALACGSERDFHARLRAHVGK